MFFSYYEATYKVLSEHRGRLPRFAGRIREFFTEESNWAEVWKRQVKGATSSSILQRMKLRERNRGRWGLTGRQRQPWWSSYVKGKSCGCIMWLVSRELLTSFHQGSKIFSVLEKSLRQKPHGQAAGGTRLEAEEWQVVRQQSMWELRPTTPSRGHGEEGRRGAAAGCKCPPDSGRMGCGGEGKTLSSSPLNLPDFWIILQSVPFSLSQARTACFAAALWHCHAK